MADQPSVVELLERLTLRHLLIGQLQAQLTEVQVQLAAARERIAELERRLGAEPVHLGPAAFLGGGWPSRHRSLLRRRLGGRPGHEGRTLRQVKDPDVAVRHEPAACSACGDDLNSGAEVGLARRQGFEILPMTAVVTEHQLVIRRCGCGACTTATAPTQVTTPVQYGPRLTAIVIYLLVAQFGAQKRGAAAVAELFGADPPRQCGRDDRPRRPPARRRVPRVRQGGAAGKSVGCTSTRPGYGSTASCSGALGLHRQVQLV